MALFAAAAVPEARVKPALPASVILRLVPDLPSTQQAPTVKRAGFATLLSGVLILGLLALLGLNLVLAKNSFVLHDLRQESRSLSHVEQALTENLARAQSPQELAARAGSLGMVPGVGTTFLRVPASSDSSLIAEPRP
jgi:hypothetical protein